MIIELNKEEFIKIKPILNMLDLDHHPVINGVVDGINRGRIYVDNPIAPTTAIVWAKMEMFYFLGNSKNEAFNRGLEGFIVNNIKPQATEIGDSDFNLEVYPFEDWDNAIQKHFSVRLNEGIRVPFIFEKKLFLDYFQRPYEMANGYEVHRITPRILKLDSESIIKKEILKFWESLDQFLNLGIGYCVIKDCIIIGTCISVFISNNEYEIGINTYSTEHRGKGLASSMAREFILECIETQKNPHWTTEGFRKDSIAIANKMGFIQQPDYKVFYIPFHQWILKNK